MVDVLKIASYIGQRYECQFGVRIDEIKLHILLYFIQRECMVQTDSPLFEDTFVAKTFGPYLPAVHTAYVHETLTEYMPESSLEKYQQVLDKVYASLVVKSTRSLSNLVHGEYSWQVAMACGEGAPIHIADIYKDAKKFRVRCFLLKNLDEFRNPVCV